MPLDIIREDITKLKVDAIVNPSNRWLVMGDEASVSGRIYAQAGIEQLNAACKEFEDLDLGDAVLTPGFNLPASHIIHVAGPVWQGGQEGEEEILTLCYRNALNLANLNGFESIAFPLLSSGTYGYPKDRALQTALSEITAYLLDHELQVTLVVYDKAAYELSQKLSSSVKDYLQDHLESQTIRFQSSVQTKHKDSTHPSKKLDDVLKQVDISFADSVFEWMDRKGMSPVETYKGANVHKAVFSKLNSDKTYRPSKTTAMAFCLSLRLSKPEAIELMNKAGYSFSPSSLQDLIVLYHIEHQLTDIHQVNAVLFEYDQAMLGVSMD